MTKIAAIALLAFKTAVRSKLFVSLMVVLALTVIGLPLTAKGDGTLAGDITILLQYTLGLAAIILGSVVLWSACGTIAHDIQEKQIQLIVTKPVHRYQIWLGKWFGLLLMSAILLSFVGVTVYALLCWRIKNSHADDIERTGVYSEILVGRKSITSLSESFDDEIHQRLDWLVENDRIPENMPYQEVYAKTKRRVLSEKSTVAPGQSKRWVFKPFSCGDSNVSVCLRFHLVSAGMDRKTVSGVWLVGTEQKPDIFRSTMDKCRTGSHSILVPVSAIPAGVPTVVTFINDAGEQAATAMFDIDDGLKLLVHWSGFKLNYLRAIVVIFFYMGLLSAFGLTAGAVFSFPVAVFASYAAAVMLFIARFVVLTNQPIHKCSHCLELGYKVSEVQIAMHKVINGVAYFISSLTGYDPVPLMVNGMVVSWEFTGKALFLLFILYPFSLGVIGVYLLKKRELALPII